MTRRWLTVLLVVAGRAAALAEAPPAALAEGGEKGLPNVRVLAYGAGFLGAADERPMPLREPPDGIAADSLITLPALADGKKRVPVLLARPDVRLIVHIPVSLLATVARADAYVYASAAAAGQSDPARVRLRPGISLAPEPADAAGWRRVRYRTPDLEVAGVVRADRVGHAYPETSGFLDGGNAEVRGDARLLASPGGPPLATLMAGPARWLPARRLATARGHVRVSLTQSDVVVEAWVAGSQARSVPAFGTGGSWATGHASGFIGQRPGAKVNLVKGTRLRAAGAGEIKGVRGEIIGLIVRDSAHELVRTEAGQAPVIVLHTRFGDAELVAEPPAR